MRSIRGWCASLFGALALLAPGAAQAIDVQFDPPTRFVYLDEVFDYDIFVPTSPDTFNAFEFVLVYDSTTLTFIQRSPLSLQVGPLMLGACANGFHLFSAVGDTIRITYSLLCAGAEVSGPGVIYRLRFRAPSAPTTTDVRFISARFANAGILLSPVVTHDGRIRIADILSTPGDRQPRGSILRPASPNPFSASSRLSFTVGKGGETDLRVFASDGREVRTLFDGWVEAGGSRAMAWDARDAQGAPVPAGVYYLRLTTADGVHTAKAILLP